MISSSELVMLPYLVLTRYAVTRVARYTQLTLTLQCDQIGCDEMACDEVGYYEVGYDQIVL